MKGIALASIPRDVHEDSAGSSEASYDSHSDEHSPVNASLPEHLGNGDVDDGYEENWFLHTSESKLHDIYHTLNSLRAQSLVNEPLGLIVRIIPVALWRILFCSSFLLLQVDRWLWHLARAMTMMHGSCGEALIFR